MKRMGIIMRLLVAAVVLIGASTVTLGFVGIRITSRFMHERFQDRIAFLARYLALNSEVGVLINDQAGLKSLALNLLGEKDVARVLIFDNQNNPLVDLSRPTLPPLSMVETPVVFKKASDENILFSDGRRYQRSPFQSSPAITEDNIGKVQILYSTHGIEQLVNTIARKFMWASMGMAAVAALFFFLMSRSIGSELKQLSVTALQIGRGDFDLRAKLGKLPETRALATSFNAMLDSLKESQDNLGRVTREMMKQKTLAEMGKFSLMVAHEVKNPLAIIKSSLDVMKTELNLSSDHTMVGYIEDEIFRLNQLIEAFLKFAKPTKPTFREVDLNQLMIDVVDRFKLLHDENNPNIVISLPTQPVNALADRDLLIRAFDNIIKNAVEATGPNGRIDITASADTDQWRVQIADDGAGIDPAHKQRIFEPFFTTRAKGTGLGLAFAAQVLKSHGGFVMAENRDPGGAVFTVELPVRMTGLNDNAA